MKTTRRQFLESVVGSSAVVSLGAAAPSFLRQAAAANFDSHAESVLVVVQLSGGNDGLNTVIPYADPVYRQQRPQLAIKESQVLKIGDSLGLHPSLSGLANLWELGRLTIVQGVGYPQPNRSHFESMDIWHTCRRKQQRRDQGWLGRAIENGTNIEGGDVPAMHLGQEKQPLALAAREVRVPSLQSLDTFRLPADNADLQAAINSLAAPPKVAAEDNLLGFLQSNTAVAVAASQRVEEATRDYTPGVEYPANGLAEKLRIVAQLVDAGLKTRIYYVTLDGFDTHANQPTVHANLLTELSSALTAFLSDIEQHGHGDRVAAIAFSEFGRRVAENASDGTDHGAAAPMLLAGKPVRGGLIGTHPRLDDLDDGDLKFHTDFRQVYATILDRWLAWPSDAAVGGKYESLKLFT